MTLPPNLEVDAAGCSSPATDRRVLIVSRVGFLGGVERIILTLAEGLAAFGWEPVIACPAGGALSEQAAAQATRVTGCEFDRMRITFDPRVLMGYPFAWKRAAKAIERECVKHRIRILHVHHPVTALYAFRASRRLSIPIVLHVHETLPAKPFYALATRVAVSRVARVICVSNAAQNLALAMGADPLRTSVVYNGVDSRFFSPVERQIRPPEIREAGPGPHVGIFGVLEPRKAQHVLLEAAAAIVPLFPSARFWLVGASVLKDKQAYADRLARLAAMEPLRGRVSLVGFQRDVRSWLAAMDIVVQSSVSLESFGMSLAEALILGRAAIATAVGGMTEVVRDQVTGIIVPPGDATTLAAALRDLLASPERRTTLGAAASVDARARFSPEAFRRSVASVYDAVSTI